MLSSRLGLGTVQFGMSYGIANRTGRVPSDVAAEILGRAATAGIDTLDTAIAYGDSEALLGAIGVRPWRVVSKLPEVPDGCADIGAWVRVSVAGSLARLGLERLYGLLLHDSRQLLGPAGAALQAALLGLKESGWVEKIGVSIYSPAELVSVVPRFRPDLVQAPFNIVDRRLETSGWLARLRDLGTEVHVRSVFLQGLLLMEANRRPAPFMRWQKLWDQWHRWLEIHSQTALQTCLTFAGSYSQIERVIVGVDTLQQLEEILDASDLQGASPPIQLASEDVDLVDPSRWVTA